MKSAAPSRLRTLAQAIPPLILALVLSLGVALPRDAHAEVPELYAVRTEHFVFTGHQQTLPVLQRLADGAETVRARICRELAVQCFVGPIRVHVARTPREFALERPGGRAQDESHVDWAVGMAFSRHGLILLRTDRNALLDIDATFEHEVSHIALRNGVGFRFLPRWFLEGIAIHQAGEVVFERIRSASQAALTGSLIPIDELVFRFPSRPPRVHLAYAESALFLRWLLREHTPNGHVEIIRRVAGGERFRDVFPEVFGDDPMELWEDWRFTMRDAASWIPVLTGTGFTWGVLTLLFLWVYRKKRREMRELMARMEEEEEAREAQRERAWHEQ